MSDIALNGARAAGLVALEALGPQGMISIRCDLAEPALAKALSDHAGVEIPAPLALSRDGENRLLWMSPDELLLLTGADAAPALAEALTQALAGVHALVADVSGARAMFRLTGEEGPLRDTLAKLTPADMSPASFPDGRVRRSRLAQVAAAFWKEGDTVTLISFRSVADYTYALLKDAAAAAGRVDYF